MNQTLLIHFPIFARRIDYSRIQMHKAEDPSNFLRRLQLSANSADMKNCPLATSILLKYTENLVENQLNQKKKQYLFEEFRKTPTIESLDSVLLTIEALVRYQLFCSVRYQLFCSSLPAVLQFATSCSALQNSHPFLSP